MEEFIISKASVLDLPSEKSGAIRAAVDALAFALKIPAESTALAVLAREQIMSTGIGQGVAIPHAKIKGLTERYYQMSVAETIAGGTSEVMRTVGAIRGLGLPRG